MMTTLHLMMIMVETLTLESPIADITETLQNAADFHCLSYRPRLEWTVYKGWGDTKPHFLFGLFLVQQWNLIYLTLKI